MWEFPGAALPAPIAVPYCKDRINTASMQHEMYIFHAFFEYRACCPSQAPYMHPGKQFLPLGNSTLLPCARFARSSSKCEAIMDMVLSVVIRKPMYE
jgi:hypothetical protein